jgi:hypothetical protein
MTEENVQDAATAVSDMGVLELGAFRLRDLWFGI